MEPPSRDQEGTRPRSRTRWGAPPVAAITKMPGPPLVESNVSQRLSGDQRGVLTDLAANVVSWRSAAPSRLATQISGWPERREAKAIQFPSGENCGRESRLVEEMNLTG